MKSWFKTLSPDEQKLIYEKIEQLERTFTSLNGYEAEALIFSLAKGLNLPQQIKTIKLRELSGGQKAKVAFAQLLYAEPDVLLLDEPTNHLDPSAKDWIIDYISSYKGAVISISHDEEYLTKIPNKILMINDKTRTSEFFTNNYSEFLDIVKLRDEYLLKTFRNQLKKIEKVENFIQRLEGTSGKKKKQAKSREKMLIKMKSDLVDVPQKSKDALISFDLENELAKSPLTISNLSFSYTSEHPILKNIDLSLLPEERFIIIGKNGAGKTTLLKLIAGILKPQKGNINITNKTIIGYYAQEHENISNMGTVLDEAKNISYTEKETRKLLGRFKFSGDKVFQSVSTLSPGERSRLALLKLCMRRPNLMLLDEPTNHLDISTKRILAGALKKYKGTILMVSHDLEFLKEFGINRMLLLPQGKVLDYNENIIKKYRQLELIGEADE